MILWEGVKSIHGFIDSYNQTFPNLYFSLHSEIFCRIFSYVQYKNSEIEEAYLFFEAQKFWYF